MAYKPSTGANTDANSIQVVARFRPLNKLEEKERAGLCVSFMEGEQVEIRVRIWDGHCEGMMECLGPVALRVIATALYDDTVMCSRVARAVRVGATEFATYHTALYSPPPSSPPHVSFHQTNEDQTTNQASSSNRFQFDRVFKQDSAQDDVYAVTGRQIVKGVGCWVGGGCAHAVWMGRMHMRVLFKICVTHDYDPEASHEGDTAA